MDCNIDLNGEQLILYYQNWNEQNQDFVSEMDHDSELIVY